MARLVCWVILLVLPSLSAVHGRTVKPARAYFKPCSRQQPDQLNVCVSENLNTLRARLAKGIRSLDLVPLEPVVFPRIELEENTCDFRLLKTFTNVSVHGLTNFTINSLNMTLNDTLFSLHVNLSVPELRVTAQYTLDGFAFILPLIGQGASQINITNVTMVTNSQGQVVTRDGQQYIDLDEVTWDLKANGSRSWFDNLYNGNKFLGEEMNKFLNDNWKDVLRRFKEVPEEALRLLFKDMAGKVFSKFSVKELFVD